MVSGSKSEGGGWSDVRRKADASLEASPCVLEDSSACLPTFVVQRAPPSGSSHSRRSRRWSTRHRGTLEFEARAGKKCHVCDVSPLQLEPMLWKIFVELSGDAGAAEDRESSEVR